ncbi:hypothetical protein RN001_000926 [Aquatica leii]|uniref:DUF4729 domain-containing protein n=1 Tax=Aquatica leii TaxID=1421715 RepID=A0AAN7SSJ3_9COLE|nr:hypothetical protein RN001_000926 [Aquatica leii]
MTKVLSRDSRCNANLCNICREIPKRSPVYRCDTKQHTICVTCFPKLPKDGGVHCNACNSSVSKLTNAEINRTRNITVEELFRLPLEKVNYLLSRSKEHLNSNINYAKENILNQWKPIKCPHGPCGKTVNCSSLQVHFSYEHTEVCTYELAKGKEVHLKTDTSIFEHGVTKCIGIIKLLSPLDNDDRKNNHLFTNPLFWLLASASEQRENSQSYILYWVISHLDNDFQYTIEMFSPVNGTSCATFCKVLDVRDNMSISEIIKTSNCLFLPYGSVKNLVDQNGKLNVCITIH